MVIRTERDFSRRVDEVGIIALPYLVFAEDRFRAKLSQAMAAVVHDYLRSDTATLQSLIDRVMGMIEEYRHSDIAGTDNIQTIDMYASELSTQEDRFKQLNEKVDAFIKKSESIKKGENKIVTQPHIENISSETTTESSRPKLVIEGVEKRKRGRPKKDAIFKPETIPTENLATPMATTTLPTTQVPTKCPECGVKLNKYTSKGGETYCCYKSRNGCGKKYVVGSEGKLIEKTVLDLMKVLGARLLRKLVG
jgi:hypothetical protein